MTCFDKPPLCGLGPSLASATAVTVFVPVNATYDKWPSDVRIADRLKGLDGRHAKECSTILHPQSRGAAHWVQQEQLALGVNCQRVSAG
jgi:hypothetical protein